MIDQSSPHLKLANKKSESESQTTCSQDDFNKTEKRNESAAVFETGYVRAHIRLKEFNRKKSFSV